MQRDVKSRAEAVLIAGPTASGKSALAARLAARFGGRVINADSMQVYRDLAILTARPSAHETAAAPHALYGTIDGATNHSVKLWLQDAETEIARTRTEGRLPILVGGTGLYFKALTQGLSDIPPVSPDLRAAFRAWAAGRSAEAMHDELARRDPATAARLRPTDPQRVLRALEVHAATGESLVAFQARRAPPLVDINATLAVALAIDRGTLRQRIEQRFDTMIGAGALAEIRSLAERRLDPMLPVMRAIGVPPLLAHLAGSLALDEAIAEAKAASRQYVKRQETFLRHQLADFRPLAPEQAEAELTRSLQSSA